MNLGAVDGRFALIPRRSRAAALQGTAVDAALDELGALPSLLGSDDQPWLSDRFKGRRPVD
jgi:hypothetical protein